MNHTQYGNVAIGAPNSLERHKSNEAYLLSELTVALSALFELRERFVPNDAKLPHVALADEVLARHKSLIPGQ